MKTIHLLRHAKSSWSEPERADHDRTLDARGEKDARALARSLRKKPIEVDLVLCSTALRARQTLEPLVPELGRDVRIEFEDALFHASSQHLLARLHKLPKRVDRVLIVGHSPGLDGLVGALAGRGDAKLREALAAKLPTCTLVTLEADVDRFADLEPKGAKLVGARRGGHGKRDLRIEKPKERKATKAKAISIDAKARWAEAATEVFEACRAHVEANVAGAEDGEIESVHQLRVALRRTRVALSVFGKLVDPVERQALGEELRWLAGKLGALREAQVLEEDLLAPLRKRSPRSPALAALARATDAQVAAQLHETRASIRGPRGAHVLTRLRALGLVDVEERGRRKAKRQAEKRLERRLEGVLEHANAITSGDPAKLHELRKQLKKLRYASEFVSSLFDVAAVHPYVNALEHLQDVIGAMQDEASSRRLVRELMVAHEESEHVARVETLVASFYRAADGHDGAALERAFSRFESSEPFWR